MYYITYKIAYFLFRIFLLSSSFHTYFIPILPRSLTRIWALLATQ